MILLLVACPVIAQAQSSQPCDGTPSSSLCNPIRYSNDDLGTFFTKAIAIATTFFTLIAVIMVAFSGFRMMLSQGDAERLSVAKSALTWSIAGLILSMFAFVLVYATANFLGAKDIPAGATVGNQHVINPLNDDTFGKLLETMLIGFLQVTGLIAILMLIVGGYRYVIARGDDEQITAAKGTIQWSIIGLVIILLSYVLVRATLTFFYG